MPDDLTSAIDSEIIRERQEIDARLTRVAELEQTAKLLRANPDLSLRDLELAARVLRRLAGNTSPQSESQPTLFSPTANGHSVESSSRAENDLADKTIVEAAVQVLGEHPGKSLHYRFLAKEAISRGYATGRKDSTEEKIERSFSQTLRKETKKAESKIESASDGEYRLRVNAKAGEG